MRSKSFQQQQWEGIYLPHVEPFNRLVDEIATDSERVPYVAPQYGGVGARLLALFRDPGPKTQRDVGSGMLCVENDDPSADRYSHFLGDAGIRVQDLMAWNSYPWYINRKPTPEEIRRGLGPLKRVVDLLPNLQVVMAHGGDAHYAWKLFSRQHPSLARRYQLIETYHTSPQALRSPDPREREARESKLRDDFARAAEALWQEAARQAGQARRSVISDDVGRFGPRCPHHPAGRETEVLPRIPSQSGEKQRETEINEGGDQVYAVWQTSRHFCEPRLQPRAVSSSLSKLEEWAKANVPVLGSKRFFFAQKVGPTQDLTDARWSVLGYLYKDGIKALRKDPEIYLAGREGRVAWSLNDTYPAPTEQDWHRPTVNVDTET
jgi:hypothetical protein